MNLCSQTNKKECQLTCYIYPPPTNVRIRGCFLRRSASLPVRQPVDLRPLIFGIYGLVPVAIKIYSAVMISSLYFFLLISSPIFTNEIFFSPTNLHSSVNSFGFSDWGSPYIMPSESKSVIPFIRGIIF